MRKGRGWKGRGISRAYEGAAGEPRGAADVDACGLHGEIVGVDVRHGHGHVWLRGSGGVGVGE